MNFEQRPTSSLRPYSGNARTHSPKQIKQIARSIERFGFNNPVLIDDDLRFEDGPGSPRPSVAANRWLRELPSSGTPALFRLRASATRKSRLSGIVVLKSLM